MKRIQRIISFLLALVMVIGMLPPMEAHAEETQPTEETAAVETVAEETVVETTTAATESVMETTEVVRAPVEETTMPTEAETEPMEETTAPAVETIPEEIVSSNAMGAATTTSGTCGDELTWILEDGIVTISGTGRMDDYLTSRAPWYEYRDYITKVVIEYGVSSISRNAFCECKELTEIYLPDSIIDIGQDAFYLCVKLVSVNIPNSVSSIGKSAFAHCYELVSINIGDSVTSIEDFVFSDCSSLTTITVGKSVTYIGAYAFSKCSDLTAISLPDGVTSIGYHAFYCCENLMTVTIPDNVASIGSYAFYGCSSLTDVKIPDGVTTIEERTFSGCNSLVSVTIGSGTTSVERHAFSNCSNLTTVFIPDSVTKIGDYAFQECVGLVNLTIGNSVTSIGSEAFSGCKELTTVVIPDSVKTIYYGAFLNCQAMVSATIGEGITSISNCAFSGCSSLKAVAIPNGLTSLSTSIFSGCTNLMTVELPDSIKTIDDSAFNGCINLSDVFYGDSEDRWHQINIGDDNDPLLNATIHYNSIGSDDEDTISGTCGENLTWSFDDGVLTISGSGAMYNYGIENGDDRPWAEHINNINSVVIENGITTIGSYAFSYHNITSVSIPDSVTAIGKAAFSNCSNLETVTIGSGVTTIEKIAFNECDNLRLIDVNNDNCAFSSKEGVLFNKDGTVLICFPQGKGGVYYVPDGVIEIGWGAFGSNCKLEQVYLPGSLKTISDLAFAQIELSEIEIPDGVTSIGSMAFTCCFELTSIVIPKSVKQISAGAFAGCSYLSKIIFEGDAPELINSDSYLSEFGLFQLVTATAYYPANNATWTQEIMDALAGTDNDSEITWVEQPSEFIKSIYQADSLIECDVINYEEAIDQINKYSPAAWILDTGIADDVATLWDSVNLLFGSLADGDEYVKYKFEQADIYETILLNVLECSTSDDSAYAWGISTTEKVVKSTKEILSRVKDFIELEYHWKLASDTSMEDLTPQKQAEFKDAFEKVLNESSFKSAVMDLKESADFVTSIMKIATTAEDLIEKTIAYLELWYVSDSMATVLNQMLLNIPETHEYLPMRDAIIFCRDMILETSREQLKTGAILRANVLSSGKYITTEGISFIWDTIKSKAISSNPELSILLIAYKGSHSVANFFLGTDNISEQLFKIRAVRMYTMFLEDAIFDAKDIYIKNKSEENAQVLLNAVALLHSFALEDCNIVYDYADIIDKTLLRKILTKAEDLIDTICGNEKEEDGTLLLKQYSEETREYFIYNNVESSTHWVHHLKDDYPEIYPEFASLIGDDVYENALVVRITSNYTIECPVDVYVYNQAGVMVAKLNTNGAYSMGDVSAIQLGDRKYITIDNGNQYSISCVGYAEGTMDISISEFSGSSMIRNSTFYTLDVSEGIKYKMEVKTNPYDNVIHTVICEEETIVADYDSCIDKCIEHTYLEPKFKWNADYSCDAIFVCQNKDDIQLMECVTSKSTSKIPESGTHTTTYIAEIIFDGKKYTDYIIVETSSENCKHAFENNICNLCGITGGTLENNMTWILDSSGRLSIIGIGVMQDFEQTGKGNNPNTPWYDLRESVTEIAVSDDITHIGNCAFGDMQNATSVLLPDGLVSMGNGCLSGCSSLTEVLIPSSVISIGASTFNGCESLIEVEIPDGVTRIEKYTFRNCKKLPQISIPEEISFIGGYAFYGCENLKEIDIPEGVSTIEINTFDSCSNLESVTLPEGITTIENYAFRNCIALQEIVIPQSVTTIKSYVFEGCTRLQEVIMSASVTTMGDGIFYNCSSLQEVVIPQSVESIGSGLFRGCSALANVIIEGSISVLPSQTFYLCEKLQQFVIPESVTEIKHSAFANCTSLKSITIPKNVKTIGSTCFDESGIQEIFFEGDAPTFSSMAFSGITTGITATVYYPENNETWSSDVMQDYGGTITWKLYTSHDIPEFEDVPEDAFYHDAVLWAAANGITTGTSATTFEPESVCTRGQIVTFLWRAAGCPEPASSVMSFDDVKAGDFYYDAVLWAAEKGITTGTSATTFDPDAFCTRGQIVTMLNRYLGGKAASTKNPFDDVTEGAFYYDAVLWAAEMEITTGTSATTFEPDATCTRGQIVTFLYRALN